MNNLSFPPYLLFRFSHTLFFRVFPAFLTLLLFTHFLPFPLVLKVSADDEPFTYPSNRGDTGLMEIPTARTIRENSYRVGATQVHPYRYYYGTVNPFKGLEITGMITEVIGIPYKKQSTTKDRTVNLKYQFIFEGKYFPALAIGIMDPQGTRRLASQYIVANKQIYPFDFTLGFGNGRFGKRPLTDSTENIKVEIFTDTGDWLRDSQFFWGIQFVPSDKYALMVEYSPIRYHDQTGDPAHDKYFSDPVPSKFNFGVRYKPTKWSEIGLSYQRGEQIGVNLSMAFDIGNPLIPIYDRIYSETPLDTPKTIPDRITRVLHKSGFSDIGVLIENNELWIEAQNDTYLFTARALGVVLKILPGLLPEDVRNIHIILKENGIPFVELVTTGQDIVDLYAERMTLDEFMQLSQIRTGLNETLHAGGRHKKRFTYGLKPDFQSYLNSREGFFKYRLGFSGWGGYHPWQGVSFIAGLDWYPLNTVPIENLDDSSIPVRSDVTLYKSRNIALGRLMVDQVKKLTPEVYGRASAGLLEVQYAGIDAEVAVPVFNGRVFLGLSGSAVKKREHDRPFRLKEDNVKDIYTTAFFNTRLNVPEQEVAVDVKAGRFLAGDSGVRFTVSKHIKGVTLWAWYSITDTSIFHDDINPGYHDKGIGISIPLRLFKGSDSRTVYPYSISPWTRDTGQDIDHFNPLFDYIGRNTIIYIDKDRKMMYR